MTRSDYMAGRVDHDTYYRGVVDMIGRRAVEALVRHVATVDGIREALKTDRHLNNIPLAKWDRMDAWMRGLLKSEHMAMTWDGAPLPPRTVVWSPSDTVCVLKAAARRMVEEAEKEPA